MLLRSNAGLRQSVVKTNIYLVSLCKISSLICSKHNERTNSLSISFQGDQIFQMDERKGIKGNYFYFWKKNPHRLIHVKMYAHALPFPCFNFFLLVLFALLYYTLIFRNLKKSGVGRIPSPSVSTNAWCFTSFIEMEIWRFSLHLAVKDLEHWYKSCMHQLTTKYNQMLCVLNS